MHDATQFELKWDHYKIIISKILNNASITARSSAIISLRVISQDCKDLSVNKMIVAKQRKEKMEWPRPHRSADIIFCCQKFYFTADLQPCSTTHYPTFN